MKIPTKFIALAAVTAMSVFALAQEGKVTLRSTAAPARVVLGELSKASGKTLVATPSVAEDVLFLNLNGVELSEAMNKIAETLNAEWVEKDGGYQLQRTSSMAAADEKADLARRAQAYKRTIDRQMAEIGKQGPLDGRSAQALADETRRTLEEAMNSMQRGGRMAIDFSKLANRMPANKAITRLLAGMNQQQLEALASGRRVVFSNRPTRMQLPLGGASNSILTDFVREQQIYGRAMQGDANSGDQRRMVINGVGDVRMGPGNPNAIGQAILVAPSNPTGTGVSLMLLVADRNGELITEGNMFVPQELVVGQNGGQATNSGGETIQLSPLAKEFATVLQSSGPGQNRGGTRFMIANGSSSFDITAGGNPGAQPKLSAELKTRILNPEKYDPFSLATSEGMAAIASKLNKNVVAYLPDDVLLPSTRLLGMGVTPENLLKSLDEQTPVTVTQDGGWLTIKPDFAAFARRAHANREALGGMLKLLDRQGYLRLDDAADYAAKQTTAPPFQGVALSYADLINSGATMSMLRRYATVDQWSLLRFYGALTPSQRQVLANGGALPFSNLTTQQLNLIAEQVFQSFDGPRLKTPPSNNQPQGLEQRTMVGVSMAGGGGAAPMFPFNAPTLQNERTLLLPNGILRNGQLRMTLNQTDALYAVNSAAGVGQFMAPQSLAFQRLQLERPDLNFTNSNPTLPDRYRLATMTNMTFLFEFSQYLDFTRSLSDASMGSGPLVTFDRLPQSIQEQVEVATQKLREGMKNVSFGSRTGGGPPPPQP